MRRLLMSKCCLYLNEYTVCARRQRCYTPFYRPPLRVLVLQDVSRNKTKDYPTKVPYENFVPFVRIVSLYEYVASLPDVATNPKFRTNILIRSRRGGKIFLSCSMLNFF